MHELTIQPYPSEKPETQDLSHDDIPKIRKNQSPFCQQGKPWF